MPQTNVIRGAESEVHFICKKCNFSELVTNHIRASIGGSIVDDDDLNRSAMPSRDHGLDASTKKLAYVPTHDDDRDVYDGGGLRLLG
jgi:hypothetical protein